MLAAVIVIAVLLTAWSLVAVGAYAWTRLRLPTRRRAFVSLTDGTTLEGLLWHNRGTHLVLRDSRLHGPDGAPVPVDGEVVVDRDRVQFIQMVNGGA